MVIIGTPFDLCGGRLGARLGPAAVRLAGLASTLSELGYSVGDAGDLPFPDLPTPEDGLKNFESCFANLVNLRDAILSNLAADSKPIVIGGDHTTGLGSIAAALNKFGDDVAVLWIDAHADCNTPASSPSGNLHGMPLAAAMGVPSQVSPVVDAQWTRFQTDLLNNHTIRPDRLAWFGLRDVDAGERSVLSGISGEYKATMYDIDRFGIVECLNRFHNWMANSGARHLWISFDVDVLDPILAPGTGTAVRGGLTYREMHLMAEMLWEFLDRDSYKLVGLDIVETNPLFDTNNETARTAVEWIASLFGKTILGRR